MSASVVLEILLVALLAVTTIAPGLVRRVRGARGGLRCTLDRVEADWRAPLSEVEQVLCCALMSGTILAFLVWLS